MINITKHKETKASIKSEPIIKISEKSDKSDKSGKSIKTETPEEPEPEPDACDGICIECEECPCETIVNDWGRLQQILDATDDIDSKISLLQTLIARNKYLCYKGECPIFTKMNELRSQIADFDLPITSLEKIKSTNLTGMQFKQLIEKYKRARYSCDKLLQEIMRVAQVNKATEQRDETLHRRRLELIDKLNESHFPLPIDVKGDIEQQLNTTSKPDDWQQAQANQANKTKENPKKNAITSRLTR